MSNLTNIDKRQKAIKDIRNGLVKILDELDENELDRVTQEESDVFMILELVLDGVLGKYEISSYHESRLRGALKRLHLLDEYGGYLDLNQVSSLLNLDPSHVQKLIDKKQLLSICISEKQKIPAFQFENNQIIFGLSDLLDSLHEQRLDFWGSIIFLLNPYRALFIEEKMHSPLEALKKGHLELVRNIVGNIHNQISY